MKYIVKYSAKTPYYLLHGTMTVNSRNEDEAQMKVIADIRQHYGKNIYVKIEEICEV